VKILSITTKTGSAVVDPTTGKLVHLVNASDVTELGTMPDGSAVYVRRRGDDQAQVVPMGSVAKMTVHMPALGREVTIEAGERIERLAAMASHGLLPPGFSPFGHAVETMREELAAERRGTSIDEAASTGADPAPPGPRPTRREKRRRR